MVSLDNIHKRINEQIDFETSDWPELVKRTDPGKHDVAARAQWVESARAGARRIQELAAERPEGASDTAEEREQRTRQALRASGRYGL